MPKQEQEERFLGSSQQQDLVLAVGQSKNGKERKGRGKTRLVLEAGGLGLQKKGEEGGGGISEVEGQVLVKTRKRKRKRRK